MQEKQKVNFSIPAKIFDCQESDNPLFSYAKLKSWYIGTTADNRVFTKEFSTNLVKSLPYVPVVGFYDDETDDFKGHNEEVQYIYGIVPEDPNAEYIEEDGKKYLVCDVILYTGRIDKTGEIAKKIIGKPHSLELNPENTTYVINKDINGKFKNVEFKTGSLLGLSILGDNQEPAFTGSEFFTKNSEFMKLFESFKIQLEEFAKKTKKIRGEKMENENVISKEPILTKVKESIPETETSFTTELDPKSENSTKTISEEKNQIEDKVEVEHADEQVDDRRQKFIESFMKVTDDEKRAELFKAFYDQAPSQDVYTVQWSFEEGILVYYNYFESKYYRTHFTQDETTKEYTFTGAEEVQVRYLTKEEINTVFTKEGVDETNEENGEEKEKFNSIALNNSERAELEAFRKDKKIILINSFKEDLEDKILNKLIEEVNNYSYEDLEIILSKEFTRIMKEEKANRNISNKPFIYSADTGKEIDTNSDEYLKELVEKYK